MATSPLLPRAQASIVGAQGIPTREFYNFLLHLASSTTDDTLQAQILALAARVSALEDEEGTDATIQGLDSVRVDGTLAGGAVIITLQGDVQDPGLTFYYGTDETGVKGWFAVADTLAGTTDEVTKTVGADGVTAFGLSDIPNLGDGAFQVFYRDAKGRVASCRVGTTDDVPEGGTNLFFTDQRAQDAVGAILDGPMSVLLSYSPGQILATLDGDAASPGVSMFYVTDALGVKSWNPQPPIELLNINGYGAAGGYLRSNGAAWERVASIPKADVGLGNVDNTSDMDKPVSTAQAAAIAAAETITGVYTPTLTNVANVTASSANPVTYLRKDNVVILSGSISITPTAAATDTRVRISIPIASNFTTGEQANGVCTIQTDTGTGNLTSNPTFDNIVVQILPSTSGSPVRVFFMGSYEVL